MDYGTSEPGHDNGAIRVLGMGNINDGEIHVPTVGSLDSVPKELILETNDLLFNRTNSPELVGKVGIFKGSKEDNISFASYLVRLRSKKDIDPRWLNFLLNSSRFWGFARSQALVSLQQANLNSTRYGAMLLPVPPKPEQKQIADSVEYHVLQFGKAKMRLEREIELVKEYRTRLIADVVTGKLDVREAAMKLPDSPSEAEPMEAADLETEEASPESAEEDLGEITHA